MTGVATVSVSVCGCHDAIHRPLTMPVGGRTITDAKASAAEGGIGVSRFRALVAIPHADRFCVKVLQLDRPIRTTVGLVPPSKLVLNKDGHDAATRVYSTRAGGS